MPSNAFSVHQSFNDLVSKYDGFILDQYGVMHNGRTALPGAKECVAELVSRGKKLIVLSNTSSPSGPTLDRLPALGFDKGLFVGAITSGDEASRYIAKTYGTSEGDEANDRKKKCLWFTWADGKIPLPRVFLDMCGSVAATDSVEEADFVLLHGSQVLRDNGLEGEHLETRLGRFVEEEDYSVIDPILHKCRERDLKMICANPDFIVVMADGSIGHMPGKIAQRYEKMGGRCMYFGKPYVPHFEACLRKLDLDKNRVAHVGDSLHHDIVGANAAGIASVFVTSGVHRKDFGSPFGELPTQKVLQEVFQKEGTFPTHVVPLLKM